MRQFRVVSSHPARQGVAYSIAAELALRGRLRAHLASVYYAPERFPYALARYVPGEGGRRLRRQLLKRRHPGLPDDMVVDWPWVELGRRALQAVPGLRHPIAYGQTYATVEAAHDAFAARWITKNRRSDGIDIVMPHHGSALHTLRAARRIGARTVLIVHHPLNHHRLVEAVYTQFSAPPPIPPSPRELEEIAAADFLMTPSALTTTSLLELGVPAERILQIPWGIDTEPLPHSARPQAAEGVRFLFVGHLSLHKGLHVLRQAWSAMTSAMAVPPVTLTLVGRPHGPVEAELLRTWEDDRVRVVDEIDDINDAYRQADVFVLPSLVEGFGLVTLEAMAAGLPVIVTERAPAVVRDGIDGFVLPSGDADALAQCMLRLAKDPLLRSELGAHAHERACEYSWDRFGSELCAWLDSVAAPSAA